MTSYERQNWIINIENSAAAVESYLGSAVVKSVFERYGAHEIQDLNPSDLPNVFSDLYAIEGDMDRYICPEHDKKLLTTRYRIT